MPTSYRDGKGQDVFGKWKKLKAATKLCVCVCVSGDENKETVQGQVVQGLKY